ncbi:MAG: peptidoglycan editing factor PgeF [Pseudomonadota bacterium]
MLTAKNLSKHPIISHGFFTRQGGVSEGLYGSLNCGFGSDDQAHNVAENRARIAADLGLASEYLLTVYQVHSPDVVEVTEPWRREEAPQADAMVTRTPGLALGILTADCVPVLFADGEAGVVGAAHAGWKGALDGVVEATIGAMESLGAMRKRVVAAIGPSIEQTSYEVGPEFPAPFLDQDVSHERFFERSPRDGHFQFDIKGYVESCLRRSGVSEIEVRPEDTYAEEGCFFSYRRSCHKKEPDYGRGLSAIALKP